MIKVKVGDLALMNDPELFIDGYESPICLVVECDGKVIDNYGFTGLSQEEISTNYPNGIQWVKVACVHVEDKVLVDFWILETELMIIS